MLASEAEKGGSTGGQKLTLEGTVPGDLMRSLPPRAQSGVQGSSKELGI